MTTLEIKCCDIPSYLRVGEFYRNLDSKDSEGIIEIPADCFHQDGKTAATVEEFRQLLRVMVFWMLDEIPLGILHFCREHNVKKWDQGIAELPGALKQELEPQLFKVYAHSDCIPFDQIIKTGRWELIMHAFSRTDGGSYVTLAAARCGNLRLLQHLHENGLVWHEGTCAAASKEGHLDCLQYAHKNGCPWDEEVCKYAAQRGHLDCLQFAHENGCPWDTLVYSGHLNCMQYAHQQGLEWHRDVCMHAAANGRLDCLKYAHENGCPWDTLTTNYAAQYGHIDCLRYALEHGCPVKDWVCSSACTGDHLECLQLLHQYGVPYSALITFSAAQSQGIDCLRYIREYGCAWDENVPDQAASSGNIEPLRYTLEHGCPYGDEIVQYTVLGNNLDCLQYVVMDQLFYMDNELFILALLVGDLANVQYLVDQGCPFLDAEFGDDDRWDSYEHVFRIDNPEFVLCVEYAVERGWTPCSNFVEYIVTRDELCRDWLIQVGFYSDDIAADEDVQSAKRKYDEL